MGNKKVIEGKSEGASEAGWHKIESFFICPKRYQYEQVRGVIVPEQFEPPAFTIGRAFHAGKAKWFASNFGTDRKAWAAVRQAIEEEAEKSKLPVKPDAIASALRYVEEYVAHWSVRPLPKPVATEYLLGPAPFKKDSPFFEYRTARLDDVSHYPEAGGALCIGESKTTSSSIKACHDQYLLHGQPVLQSLLWKYAPQGLARFGPVKFVMLDIIKKGYGAERSQFGRVPIPVTERVTQWYEKNLAANLRAAAMVTWDTDVPRNITSCTRMYGRALVACPYRDLCVHGRSASMKYTMQDGNSLVAASKGREIPAWE